jgi:hypothetical protein
MQSRELVASALGVNLYTAIVIIPHPPGDPEDMSLALDEPTEADPLHASAHEEPAGFNGLFSRGHATIQRFKVSRFQKFQRENQP